MTQAICDAAPPATGAQPGERDFHVRFFDSLLKHHLIFNTSWEDPALDRVALQLGPGDRLVAITGAGCNVLDYLLAGAGEVHAVDMNPCQSALLELKVAALRCLSYEDFFELFGRGRSAFAREMYHDSLRSGLGEFSRRWWDRHLDFFDGRAWHQSFYYRGTAGFGAKIVLGLVRGFRPVWGAVEALLEARTIDEQREVYESRLRDRLWSPWMRWFLSQPATLSLVGVPKGQHEEMLARYPSGAADYIRDCFETVVTRLPFQDNYFWRVYARGHYTPECCPEYLKRENFNLLKAAVGRLRIHTRSLTEYLRASPPGFTRFVLLDHMDWMRGKHRAALAEEWSEILGKAAPRARVIYRSAGRTTPWLDPLTVRHRGRAERLGGLLERHSEWADSLHARDRVHTYGSFHIVDLPA
jgi:S-adenosylmethionine-diacylglycerol 3-amino-3-carboxypropyl transferase